MTKQTFTKLNETRSEKLFEVSATASDIVKVRAYEPELRGTDIVLPVEFVKADGETVTLGFTLDADHLRGLIDAADFPDVVG